MPRQRREALGALGPASGKAGILVAKGAAAPSGWARECPGVEMPDEETCMCLVPASSEGASAVPERDMSGARRS